MKHDWEYKKLGEVASYINGYAFKPEQWSAEGTPIIRIQNLNNQDAPFNYFDGDVPDKVKIKNGDLLISWSASLGAYIWSGGNAFLNQHIFKVAFDKSDINKYFLKYAVSSKLEAMGGLVHGATMKHIVKKDFDNTKIPFPPLPVQQQIVAELDKLSEIIEKKKQQVKELDTLAQSIFYDMFGDPVENEKGWEVKKMKDCCTKIGSGATPKGGDSAYKSEGISLVRSLNVHNQGFRWNDLAYIDDEQASKLSNVVLEEFDVLLNITGASVARCCVLPLEVLPGRVNQHVSILRCKQDMLLPCFLKMELTNPMYQRLLISLSKSNGATREALPKSVLESLKIILPPLPLQQSFAQKIEAIEKQKELINQSIKEAQTLFDSRMDYYFGE